MTDVSNIQSRRHNNSAYSAMSKEKSSKRGRSEISKSSEKGVGKVSHTVKLSPSKGSPPMHPFLGSDKPLVKKQKCLASFCETIDQGRTSRRSMYQSYESTTPSPSTKRCCKQDLKRCLKVGEILEVTRVEQHYLDAFNHGEKIRGRFTGNDIFDLTQNIPYRSLSKWVKKRLVDVGALGHKSNISGWDFVAVERNGRKQSLRMLVENVESDSGSNGEPGSQSTSPSSGAETMQRFFGIDKSEAVAKRVDQTSIAERMQQLFSPPDLSPLASSSSAVSSPDIGNELETRESSLRNKCASLREELTQARAYMAHIETQLIMREKQLERCIEENKSTEETQHNNTGYQLRSR